MLTAGEIVVDGDDALVGLVDIGGKALDRSSYLLMGKLAIGRYTHIKDKIVLLFALDHSEIVDGHTVVKLGNALTHKVTCSVDILIVGHDWIHMYDRLNARLMLDVTLATVDLFVQNEYIARGAYLNV